MASILPFRANKLAFPGTLPGLNPAHPASQGLRLFAFPQGVHGQSLAGSVGFQKGTGTNALTPLIDPAFGPCLFSSSALTDCFFTAPVLPTTTAGSGFTFASFIRDSNTGTNNALMCSVSDTSNGGEGLFQGIVAGVFVMRITATVSFSSGIPALSNVPYFYASSLIYRGSSLWDHYHVVLRLDTGSVTTAVVTGTSAAAIAFFSTTVEYAHSNPGSYGPAMSSTVPLSLNQLLAWAQDPWAFWYPQRIDLAEMLATSAAVVPPTVKGNTLPLMGVA